MSEKASRKVGYQLKRAQQALRTAMDQSLRELGISTAQYAALSVLEESAPLSGAELARRCFVTPQTMNGIVLGLEKTGYVERSPHENHGRVLETLLTEEGRALLHNAHRIVGVIEKTMLEGFEEEERKQLWSMLCRCVENLTQDS